MYHRFNKRTEEVIYHIEPPRPPLAMQGTYPNATTAPWGVYGKACVPCPPQIFYAPPIMSISAIPPAGQHTMSAVPPWAVPPSTIPPTPMPFQSIMQVPTSSSYAPPTTPFVNVDNTANIANVTKTASNGDVTNQDYVKKEKNTKNVYGRIKHAENSTQGEKQKGHNLELELEVPLEKEETSDSTSSDIPNTAESFANDVAKETNASTYAEKPVKSESISNSKLPGENSRFAQLNRNVSLDVPEVEVDFSESVKNAKGGKLAGDENGVKIEQGRNERTKAGKEEKDCLKEEENEGPKEEKDDAKKEEEEEAKMGEKNANEEEQDAKEEEDDMREAEEAEEITKEEEGIKREDVTIEDEDVVKEDGTREEVEEITMEEEEGTEEGEDVVTIEDDDVVKGGAKDEAEDAKDETVHEKNESVGKEDTTEKTEENEDTNEEAINDRQDTTKEVEALAPPAPRPKKYTTKRFGWFGFL